MPDQPNQGLSNRRFWALLAAIVLVGAAWRAWRLETPSLDNDEVWQVVNNETDLSKQVFRHDNFPPLYNWLVSFAIQAGGDQAARWFSLGAGVFTILLTGLLGRRLGGPTAGLAAAGLLAVSANHVLICQHGRAYAPLVLVASLMMLTAWRLRASDRWTDWAAFLVASWIAVATHYFSGILLILLGGMLLIEKRGQARLRAMAAAGLLAIAGLALVPGLREDLKDYNDFYYQVQFDPEAYVFGYLWLVTGNTLGPSVSHLREMVSLGEQRQAILAMAPWALLAFAPVATLGAVAWPRIRPADRVWIAVLMLGPPLVALAASPVISTGYNYRYFVWMIVPLSAALGVGAAQAGKSRLAQLGLAGLVALGVGATLNRHLDPYYAENDFHAVAALIQRLSNDEGSPAVVTAPLHYGKGVIYGLPGGWLTQAVSANPRTDQDWDSAIPAFADRLGDRREAWLVTQWFPLGHPQRAVCDALAERLDATFIERVSSTVMVYRFAVEKLR